MVENDFNAFPHHINFGVDRYKKTDFSILKFLSDANNSGTRLLSDRIGFEALRVFPVLDNEETPHLISELFKQGLTPLVVQAHGQPFGGINNKDGKGHDFTKIMFHGNSPAENLEPLHVKNPRFSQTCELIEFNVRKMFDYMGYDDLFNNVKAQINVNFHGTHVPYYKDNPKFGGKGETIISVNLRSTQPVFVMLRDDNDSFVFKIPPGWAWGMFEKDLDKYQGHKNYYLQTIMLHGVVGYENL